MKLSGTLQAAASRSDMLSHVWQCAKRASRICGKPTVSIFADMLLCAKRYGAGPSDYLMFRFWECSAQERSTFLTRVRSAALVRKLNDTSCIPYFEDKNIFAEKFAAYTGRESYNLFTGSYEGFLAFLKDKAYVMAKPVDTDCGRGIEKLRVADFESREALWAYLTDKKKPFGIVEDVLAQHEGMAALHPASVNCVRINTLVKDDGEPIVIYAACKAGTGGGPCDNTGRGGITCSLDIETGLITSHGHDDELNEHITHPDTGIPFKGYHIPMAAECKALALKAALEYPGFRYVGWDICVTPTGPVLVEGNDYPGYDLAQMPDRDTPHPWTGLVPRFTDLGFEV